MCLSKFREKNLVYDNFGDGGFLTGAVYSTATKGENYPTVAQLKDRDGFSIPCAECGISANGTLMIPGKQLTELLVKILCLLFTSFLNNATKPFLDFSFL